MIKTTLHSTTFRAHNPKRSATPSIDGGHHVTLLGFFAYASEPSEVSQTIELALDDYSRAHGPGVFRGWRENDIAGRFLASPIFEQIQSARCLVADVSVLNFNVTFEIGYAIGIGRRVCLVKNKAVALGDGEVRKVGIFDTLGYIEYQNARELKSLLESINDFEPIAIQHNPDRRSPIYMLQYGVKTDAQLRIIARVKRSRLRFRSFDPAEQSRISASEAIEGVAGAFGVLIPLAAATMPDARVHNIRAAFLAGLSVGMGRQLLILQQGEDPVPLDYRDLVVSFKHPNQIDEAIASFALEVTDALQATVVTDATAGGLLASLDLGASTAENEFINLHSYYLSTDQFQRALRGEARIVVGRKGAGKTALFAQLRDRVRSNRKMIVLDLRPEGYQLKKFKEYVLDFLEEGTKEHTITAFWEYLLLLEIAYKILEKDKVLHLKDHTLLEPYQRLSNLYTQDSYSQEGDFSERMLSLIDRISSSFSIKHELSEKMRLARQEVTEFVYVHDVRKLRTEVEAYLREKDGVWILFDNLDKAWATNGVSEEDILLVRCLLDATRKLEQGLRRRQIDCRTTIFIRNDVFSMLVSATPDRGKEALVSLDWQEPDLLRAMLERRLRYNSLEGTQFEDIWRLICVSHVNGEDSAQYIIDRCLMRPRFLLNLISHCRSFAVNFEHEKIEESDVEKGLAAYSTDLIYDIDYEIRDVLPEAEDVLYLLLGRPALISEAALDEIFTLKFGAGISKKVVEVLLWYGVIGVKRNDEDAIYIHNVNYDMKRLQYTLSALPEDRRRYFINPAFWLGLEIAVPVS